MLLGFRVSRDRNGSDRKIDGFGLPGEVFRSFEKF